MILAALALAAASTSAATPQAAIAAIYAPFSDAKMRDAAWERPIFTSQLQDLIAKWRAVTPSDEIDDLSDFDWLCQCQDWDLPTLRARIISNRRLGPTRRAVAVTLTGSDSPRAPIRLVLQRKGSRWLIDDIFGSGFRGGLRAALVRTTAADIALRKQR